MNKSLGNVLYMLLAILLVHLQGTATMIIAPTPLSYRLLIQDADESAPYEGEVGEKQRVSLVHIAIVQGCSSKLSPRLCTGAGKAWSNQVSVDSLLGFLFFFSIMYAQINSMIA